MLKTLIVGERYEVLTSTYNLCLGSKIRKIGLPLQMLFFFFSIYILVGFMRGCRKFSPGWGGGGQGGPNSQKVSDGKPQHGKH